MHNWWPIDPAVAERVDGLDLSFNAFGTDPYGIDKEGLAQLISFFSWFYRFYFQVEVFGLKNVPPHGRAMMIGNHSGGVAIDAAMVIASLVLDADPPRLAQGMIENFIHRVPWASQIMSRAGQFTGNPDQAERLLEDERLLLVFPEGARGTAKLAKDADTLVRFGTGFMRLALKTRSPIVPFGFVGGGDAMPTVLNLKRFGRLMGVPYIPITKYLVPIPKRTRLQLLYGKPMRFEGSGNERDEVIDTMVDKVRARIKRLIQQGRAYRQGELAGEAILLT